MRARAIAENHQDLPDDGWSRSGQDRLGCRRNTFSRRRRSRGMEGGLAGVRLLVPEDQLDAALSVLGDTWRRSDPDRTRNSHAISPAISARAAHPHFVTRACQTQQICELTHLPSWSTVCSHERSTQGDWDERWRSGPGIARRNARGRRAAHTVRHAAQRTDKL